MKTDEGKRTCEERIDEEMQNRLEEILPDSSSWSVRKCKDFLRAQGREISEVGNRDELRNAVHDTIRDSTAEMLLSCEKILTFKLCLSWGGPADYFELDWSVDSSCWLGGRYIFQDWFDGAVRPLETDQVERLADIFGIHPDG